MLIFVLKNVKKNDYFNNEKINNKQIMSYPDNHRNKWTDKETKTLYKEAKLKLDLAHIANTHKRTIGAIKFKLIRYAIELSEEDETLTLNDLSKITNLSKEILLEGFRKLHYDFIENDLSEDTTSEASFIDKTKYPSNHGLKWTDEETSQLYKEIENKIDFDTIALNHKRTVEAIYYKLFRNAVKLYLNDNSLSLIDLSKLSNLPIDYLLDKFISLNIMPHYDNSEMTVKVEKNKLTICERIIMINYIIIISSIVGVCIYKFYN